MEYNGAKRVGEQGGRQDKERDVHIMGRGKVNEQRRKRQKRKRKKEKKIQRAVRGEGDRMKWEIEEERKLWERGEITSRKRRKDIGQRDWTGVENVRCKNA